MKVSHVKTVHNNGLIPNLIVSGLTLGTAWAIRGKFGHEQGAAWAGAIGALIILLLARREDWYTKMFKVAFASAIGWGLGGMMSYGKVVGYGRGYEFGNVFYGFLMLFVIGGLYGFLGGGLFGLTLADTKENKVKWPILFTGMISGGAVTYFFLIMQWEWLMTPPRSEAWAICFGMALFMWWFLQHNKMKAAMNVAFYAGIGGGFGFTFGNFLQVLGNVAEIQFSMWNVMEYSLGFFGGIGMAYGTFTAKWEKGMVTGNKPSNLIPMLMVVLFIPFVVWNQSFTMDKLQETYLALFPGNGLDVASFIRIMTVLLVVIMTLFVWFKYYSKKGNDLIKYTRSELYGFFWVLFGVYLVFSFLKTGAYIRLEMLEHYLYIVNFALVLLVLPKLKATFSENALKAKKWPLFLLIIVFVIAILALIAISTHGEMPGMQERFGLMIPSE